MQFLDCLYGNIQLDIDRELLSLPEVQRLREIRLCNINSPYLTGGSNINRFEHAIGTCFLAQEFSKHNSIPVNEKQHFMIASLLHDVVTPPFAHSLEYLFENFGITNYEHANIHTLLSGSTTTQDRAFFIGLKSKIKKSLVKFDISKILKIINGEDVLSSILSAEIDIDNIDNVFRFAYHLGLNFNKTTPRTIATSLRYTNNILHITPPTIPLITEWFNIRQALYKLLLENEGEFAAKSLLERIFIDLIEVGSLGATDWIKTDYELVEFILKDSRTPHETKKTLQNLMTMNLPKYSLILQSDEILEFNKIAKNKIKIINEIHHDYRVFIHFISDINKTCRPIKAYNTENNTFIQIGEKRDRLLIGLFSDKKDHFNTIRKHLANQFAINTSEVVSRDKTQLSLI